MVEKFLFALMLVLLSASTIQHFTGFFEPVPLSGVTIETKQPVLSISTWFGNTYQERMNKYLEENIGFRPSLVRLTNQLDFSLFGVPHGYGVVIGKNNFLFERWFIQDYLGEFCIGIDSIQRNIARLQEIRRFLNSHNTELLIVLAPGKGHFYQDFIPARYRNRKRVPGNYELYAHSLKDSDIPFLDVNSWFIELKESSPAPLFTQTGTHWSEYGAKLVADSLIRLTEILIGRKMNHIKLKDLTWTKELRSTDGDLEKLMNLIYPVNKMLAAYPTIEKEQNIAQADRPAMILIGDSFFWNIYDGTLDEAFRSISYWYYYNSIFPDSYKNWLYVKDITVPDKLREADIVIIMYSTTGLIHLGSGFIEDLFGYLENDRQN